MKQPNAALLFYKAYFEPNATIVKINQQIFDSSLIELPDTWYNLNADCFNYFIGNPGAIIGAGYAHDYKSEKDSEGTKEAVKSGFSFDYTTGLPVLPGASLKGILRSLFPQKKIISEYIKDKDSIKRQEILDTQLLKYQFVKELFVSKIPAWSELSDDQINSNIEAIEDEIFEGIRNNKSIGIYERDTFFGAIPVDINPNTNISENQKQLLSMDNITPHKHKNRNLKEMDPFVEPNPIKILKVMPGVKYKFMLQLHNSKLLPEISKELKLEIFKTILEFLGIGAKTNSGYGNLVHEYIKPNISGDYNETGAGKPVKMDIVKDNLKGSNTIQIPMHLQIQLKKDATFEAVIVRIDENYGYIEIKIKEEKITLKKKKNHLVDFRERELVRIRFNENFTPQNPNFKVLKYQ